MDKLNSELESVNKINKYFEHQIYDFETEIIEMKSNIIEEIKK